MFHRYSQKVRVATDLTRVLSAAQLYSDEKLARLQKNIANLMAFSSERFDDYCFSLLNTLANYYQNLPHSSFNFYADEGGLIEHALDRTEIALQLFNSYLILDDDTTASLEQQLWQYALFSAALLQGIGRLHTDYTVQLFDKNGQHVDQWKPVLTPIVGKALFYKYTFKDEDIIDRSNAYTALMARAVMPAKGFEWIASNSQVLEVWLSLLNEDFEGSGTLGAILGRAEAMATRRLLLLAQSSYSDLPNYNPSTFNENETDSLSIEQQTGLKFVDWLYNQLDNEKYVINNNGLILNADGLAISQTVFQDFTNATPNIKNWQAAQRGFLSLDLHQLIAGGRKMTNSELTLYQQKNSAAVFARFGIALPSKVQLFNPKTKKTEQVSSLSLATTTKLQHVNASGQWQDHTAELLTHRPSGPSNHNG